MRYKYTTDIEIRGRRRYLKQIDRYCIFDCLDRTARFRLTLTEKATGEEQTILVCALHIKRYTKSPNLYTIHATEELPPVPEKSDKDFLNRRRKWRTALFASQRVLLEAAFVAADDGDEATAKAKFREIGDLFTGRDAEPSPVEQAVLDQIDEGCALTGEEFINYIDNMLARVEPVTD